tara:strand:+ start:840 stop:947 length:108 start_codon:yes stop_codon:yes gene_type:complete
MVHIKDADEFPRLIALVTEIDTGIAIDVSSYQMPQ